MQRKEDLNYISKHPELTVALELIFENLCTKCDERGLSSQSQDFEFESRDKSPVQLTIEFLSDQNLDNLVQQRLQEKKNEKKF